MTDPTSPEKTFIKPISEHPRLQKSEKSEKSEKSDSQPQMQHNYNSYHESGPRSQRSNSVRSNSSRHSSIIEDVDAKINESLTKHEQPSVPQMEVSIIQKYLDIESQFFSEYSAIDISKQFNYAEYLQWRHNTQHLNEQHKFLQPYDIIIIEKYVMDSLNQSEYVVPDLNEKAYYQYREKNAPYFTYVELYLAQSYAQQFDVSYYSYQYFAQMMQQRDESINMFRKYIIASNQVSYSEEYFKEFIASPDCKFDLQSYDAFYQVKAHQERERQKQNILAYKNSVAELKKEIENLNLYIYDSFIEGCTEQNVEPTKQGYLQHEKDLREQFDDDYLKEKHQQLEAEVEQLHIMDEQGKIANLDQKEIDYVGQYMEGTDKRQTNLAEDNEPSELEAEQLLLESTNCECCHGHPYDCYGEACALLGECICQSKY